jgi:hypothetical protein
MSIREIHKKAMDFSFKAKQSISELNFSDATKFYTLAAEAESEVADFYMDKIELEPTRSIMIRSAAFLNLKAGKIQDAQKYILFGILNTSDLQIKEQLQNALEISASYGGMSPDIISKDYNYINVLRQQSTHYIIEPSNIHFGKAVTLDMLNNFSNNYLKSIKSYARSKFKEITNESLNEKDFKVIDEIINPLITNTAYGSFKFSVANDFIKRIGESDELQKLKTNIVEKYHKDIFINPLTDEDIKMIKESYDEDEINDIFRPIAKIKATNSSYKVGYYDTENYKKIYVEKIINKQRKKLLPVKKISKDQIGELESLIVHKRSSETGKISSKTILKEHLKSYEFEITINKIEPKNKSIIYLNNEIIINILFTSDFGFKFTFDDINIGFSSIDYNEGLQGFHDRLYDRIIKLINIKTLSDNDKKDFDIINGLIGNLNALLKEK